jgi:hypothetical protein
MEVPVISRHLHFSVSRMILWLVATALGGFFLFSPQFLLGIAVSDDSLSMVVVLGVSCIFGLIAGTLSGIIQQRVYPSFSSWERNWLLISILGWTVYSISYWLLLWLIHFINSKYPSLTLEFQLGSLLINCALVLAGSIMGVSQFLLIGYRASFAKYWLGATIVGWVLISLLLRDAITLPFTDLKQLIFVSMLIAGSLGLTTFAVVSKAVT